MYTHESRPHPAVKRKVTQHEHERGPSGVLLYLIIKMSSVCCERVTQTQPPHVWRTGGMWTLTISSCTPETVPGKKRQTETSKPFCQLAAVSSKQKSWLLLLPPLHNRERKKMKLLRITNNPTCLLKRSPSSPPRASGDDDDDDDDHTSCDSRSWEISWITLKPSNE